MKFNILSIMYLFLFSFCFASNDKKETSISVKKIVGMKDKIKQLGSKAFALFLKNKKTTGIAAGICVVYYFGKNNIDGLFYGLKLSAEKIYNDNFVVEIIKNEKKQIQEEQKQHDINGCVKDSSKNINNIKK